MFIPKNIIKNNIKYLKISFFKSTNMKIPSKRILKGLLIFFNKKRSTILTFLPKFLIILYGVIFFLINQIIILIKVNPIQFNTNLIII